MRVGDINDHAPKLVAYEAITASATATSSSTAVAAITTDPLTFNDGRAYRISYRGGLTSNNLGQQGTVLVTKGTAAGSSILNSQRIMAASGQAGTVGFYFENVVANQSGTDVTTVLVGTYQMTFQVNTAPGGGAQTGTVAIFGSATTPAYLEIVDIGPASDYPGATAL